MKITLAFVVVLAVLFPADLTRGGFTVLTGNTTENVTATVLNSTYCGEGPSKFPKNLTEGAAAAPPENMTVSSFVQEMYLGSDLWLMPGLQIKWKLPTDEKGRQLIKGFYIKLVQTITQKVICKLIDLQKADLTDLKQSDFYYDFFPLHSTISEMYQVALTSLPLTGDTLSQQAVHQVTLPLAHKLKRGESVQYPYQWVTRISLKLDVPRGTVQVTFDYPSVEYPFIFTANFTSFDLQLITPKASNPLMRQIVNRSSVEETSGTYTFRGVPQGTYKVQLMPLDQFINDADKCQCWRPYPNWPSIRMCGTCRFSATAYFNFREISHSLSTSKVLAKGTQASAEASLCSRARAIATIVVALTVSVFSASSVLGY